MLSALLKLINGDISAKKSKKKVTKSIKNYINTIPAGNPKLMERRAKRARLLHSKAVKLIEEIDGMK